VLLEVDMTRGAPVACVGLPWHASGVCLAHTEPPLLLVCAGLTAHHGRVLPVALPLPSLELVDDSGSSGSGSPGTDAGGGGGTASGVATLSDAAIAGAAAGTSSGVAAMQLSVDGSRLFAAGYDGSVLVYDVRDAEGRLPASDASSKAGWCEEVLIALPDYEERRAGVRELREQLAEVGSNADYSTRMREIGHRDALRKLTEK
jgi:hypothetical protein